MYGKLNTDERRRFARVPLETFFTGYTGPGNGILLRSYDVGRGGLKVAGMPALEPGSRIMLEFGDGAEVLGRVEWCVRQPGAHGHRAGIRTFFDEADSVDLMGQLMFAGLVQSGALPLGQDRAVTLLGELHEPESGPPAALAAACD